MFACIPDANAKQMQRFQPASQLLASADNSGYAHVTVAHFPPDKNTSGRPTAFPPDPIRSDHIYSATKAGPFVEYIPTL